MKNSVEESSDLVLSNFMFSENHEMGNQADPKNPQFTTHHLKLITYA